MVKMKQIAKVIEYCIDNDCNAVIEHILEDDDKNFIYYTLNDEDGWSDEEEERYIPRKEIQNLFKDSYLKALSKNNKTAIRLLESHDLSDKKWSKK